MTYQESKDSTPGYARHKIILDDSGKPYDYKFLETNATFEKLTGLKKEEIIGRTVREAIPGIEKSDFDWIGFYGKIALEGGEKDFKQYSEPLEKWYRVLAYSTEKMYFTTLFVDITEQKQSEKALKESEERLDMALEIKNEGIWDWNLITDQTVFDDRYYTMAGYEPNEFPSDFKSWAEHVHPEDRLESKNAIKSYLSGQSERFDIEFRFRHKNGSWIWIGGQGKIVERDKNGSPLRMIGTHTDITKLKETEKALFNNQETLSAILSSIEDGVIGCDKKERVVNINKSAETLTGWTKKEAVGQPLKKVFNIIDFETGETIDNSVIQTIEKGISVDLSCNNKLISKDGKEYHVSISCVPIKNKTGSVDNAVLIFRHIKKH
ncbi:MAG: PAS domain-containing protein [bacterium]